MKKIMTLVLSILLGAVLPVMAQNCLPLGKDRAFQSGEQLTFSLMYKWGAVNTEVGMAELSIDSTSYNGIPAYHSALKVKSMPFFDVFFKMREHFQGWMAQDNVRRQLHRHQSVLLRLGQEDYQCRYRIQQEGSQAPPDSRQGMCL